MTRILVVDDNQSLRQALAERLSFMNGMEVVGAASDGSEAVSLAQTLHPDVVIMDVQMPVMDGIEATRRIHEMDPACQVVAHTAFEDGELVSEMIRAGAKAYLLKGGQPDDLFKAIHSVTDGQSFVAPRATRPLLDDLETLYRREQERSRDLERMVDQLQALAVTDFLTGLANHQEFHRRLEAEMERAEARDGSVAVIQIDLDDFHLVNNRFGHHVGDEVLRQAAARMKAACPSAAVLARTGAEEFTIVVSGAGTAAALDAADKVLAAIRDESFEVAGELTASAGIAIYPLDAATKDDLLQHTERALRAAKARGKDGAVPWRPGLEDAANADVAREAGLRAMFALARAVDARDPYTGLHSQRLARYARAFALGMGVHDERLGLIRASALLHDVGKIGVRDAVLLKPGALDDDEYAEMKEHPVLGERIVTGSVDHQVRRAIRHHHERVDGKGYPDGLKGEGIPFVSRVLLVADAFDAMTSNRIYRMALSVERAMGELRKHAGTQFDPDVVASAVTLVESGAVTVLE